MNEYTINKQVNLNIFTILAVLMYTYTICVFFHQVEGKIYTYIRKAYVAHIIIFLTSSSKVYYTMIINSYTIYNVFCDPWHCEWKANENKKQVNNLQLLINHNLKNSVYGVLTSSRLKIKFFYMFLCIPNIIRTTIKSKKSLN